MSVQSVRESQSADVVEDSAASVADPTPSDEEVVEGAEVEIGPIRFNCKDVAADRAFDQAIKLVTKGAKNWARTDLTIVDRSSFQFKLSCSKCNKNFSCGNPGAFWSTHSTRCPAASAPQGQVLEMGAGATASPLVCVAYSPCFGMLSISSVLDRAVLTRSSDLNVCGVHGYLDAGASSTTESFRLHLT